MKTVFYHTLLFTLFLCVGLSIAQVSVENTATTDSVDLFKPEPEGVSKSLTLALSASVILPGTGHQYLERNRPALVYLSVEALSIFTFFFCDRYANKTAQDAAGYAWVHAKATGSIRDADESRWRLIGSFMDVQEYNNVMDLNRTPEKMITDEALAWYWDDQSSQDRFNEIRTTSRSFRIISKFFLGAMVLNRVVSFIDIRMTARNKGIIHSGRVLRNVMPYVSATPKSMNLAISGVF